MSRGSDAYGNRLTLHGRLVRIKDQDVLFSPSERAIFSLNPTAADVWRSLEDGLAPKDIAQEIERSGVAPCDAEGIVAAALEVWRNLGLVRPAVPPAAPSNGDVVQMISVAGVVFRIVYPPEIAQSAAAIFQHLEVRSDHADVLVQLVEVGGRVHLFRSGAWVLSCETSEVATLVKGQLLTDVLDRGDYELALHAAALRRHDRILLLSGNPGAGKTTLTMALVHAGLGFAGDDVALLDTKGHCLGLPFAPAVKAGAWGVLSGAYPELASAPVFRRPDRRRVRYPVPKDFVVPSPLPVGWVLLLRRDSSATASLEPVDGAGALRGLLNGAFAVPGALTCSAFDMLTRVIENAEVFALSYSRLEDAVALVRERTADARG